MLTIFVTSEVFETVKNSLAQVPRLDELVTIKDFLREKPQPCAFDLIVRKNEIRHTIDWFNVLPPYLLPEAIPLSTPNLLGLIFFKLGNTEQAYEWLADNRPLLVEVDMMNCLQNGISLNPDALATEYSAFDEYRLMHNHAILRHYASEESDFDAAKTQYFYREALQSAPNDEYKAFSAKHFATFLTDMQQLDEAENVLLGAANYALSDEAKTEIKSALAAVWLKKLVVPYDNALLSNLKNILWEVLQTFEKQGRTLETALTLVDASHVANIAESFSESLGYINKAIDIFRRENQKELLANVQYRKGTLLYTWAKKGNPQFFKGAIEAYQQALRVFNREDTPSVFADIQHHLGVIYSEIPDEAKKKSVWAAVSSAAFQDALQFYTKTDFPYEYAMVCNSYGNALSKYPAAIHSDNHEKALFYYQEALEIRTAAAFPIERALTLLNFLEASWNVGTQTDEEKRLEDMKSKAREVKMLSTDPTILAEADLHLRKLETLAQVI